MLDRTALAKAVAVGEQTVPDALRGCWRRNWIQFDGGDADSSVTVIWLQTASGMGDLRLDPVQDAASGDSSCGITIVEPTTPYATADWQDGETGFAQQSVSNFPEKGLLAWDSTTIMRELAPSGAYVEEWERLPGSDGPFSHLTASNAATLTNLYIAGSHYLLAVQDGSTDPVHEFSYGVHSPVDAAPLTELSTHSSALGQTLQLDYDWTIVSHRTK